MLSHRARPDRLARRPGRPGRSGVLADRRTPPTGQSAAPRYWRPSRRETVAGSVVQGRATWAPTSRSGCIAGQRGGQAPSDAHGADTQVVEGDLVLTRWR